MITVQRQGKTQSRLRAPVLTVVTLAGILLLVASGCASSGQIDRKIVSSRIMRINTRDPDRDLVLGEIGGGGSFQGVGAAAGGSGGCGT